MPWKHKMFFVFSFFFLLFFEWMFKACFSFTLYGYFIYYFVVIFVFSFQYYEWQLNVYCLAHHIRLYYREYNSMSVYLIFVHSSRKISMRIQTNLLFFLQHIAMFFNDINVFVFVFDIDLQTFFSLCTKKNRQSIGLSVFIELPFVFLARFGSFFFWRKILFLNKIVHNLRKK